MDSILPGLEAAPNIHPLIVHVPVALLPTALLFFVLGAWKNRDELFAVGRWLLYLAVAGCAAAVASGLAASEQLGHDTPGHEAVHTHRDFMIAASILAAVVAIAAFALRRRTTPGVRGGLVAGLLVANTVTILGADRGAYLVFGHGTGTAVTAGQSGGDHDHGQSDDDHGQSDADHGHEQSHDDHGNAPEPDEPDPDRHDEPANTDAGTESSGHTHTGGEANGHAH